MDYRGVHAILPLNWEERTLSVARREEGLREPVQGILAMQAPNRYIAAGLTMMRAT